MKKKIIILIVLDVIIALCFFLTYGPIKYFKNFLITTAMTTKSHKYLAKTFYSEKTINKVLSQNTVSKFAEGTDTSQIIMGGEETASYASIYEKQILERKENEAYKLIEFEYEGYDSYLVAVYDPSRVSLVQTSQLGSAGETLLTMAKANKALVAVNGGGFEDFNGYGNGGRPQGVVIKNGKVVWGSKTSKKQLAGFTKDNVLMLTTSTANDAIKNGMRDAVQFGPFLIVNGKAAKITGNGGWGVNPRTVVAQRKDGIVLFLVVDGNGVNKYDWNGRGGVTMSDLLVLLKRYGAYNAVNMDGGASTTLVVGNKLHNKPCAYGETGERYLPNGWMVK